MIDYIVFISVYCIVNVLNCWYFKAVNFCAYLAIRFSRTWPSWAIECNDVANVKAVAEGEGHLGCWWIYNEALLHAEEWAGALHIRNLCVLMGRVAHGSHVLALGCKGDLPFYVLHVVHFLGCLLGLMDWLTGRKMLICSSCCFLTLVCSPDSFLSLLNWLTVGKLLTFKHGRYFACLPWYALDMHGLVFLGADSLHCEPH